jgi:adenine phosphoribosyltransferase
MDIKALIRDIPDFPKEGILFRDITTLLQDAAGFKATIDAL